MNNEEPQMLVSRRNGASVEQALRIMAVTLDEQNKTIANLSQGMSAMAVRLSEMERMLAIHKATTIGSGPTVK